MGLNSKHKVEASFSMSSMTDVVFLLLIFFMLTSNFITPSGLNVDLPSSKSSTIVLQKVRVVVSEDRKFYINDEEVAKNSLESILQKELSLLDGGQEGKVTLYVDKSVPSEDLIYVVGIASKLKAKATVVVEPEK